MADLTSAIDAAIGAIPSSSDDPDQAMHLDLVQRLLEDAHAHAEAAASL